MAAHPRKMVRCKTLRLACSNADRTKLEMEYFLGQHGVDICIVSETSLKPDQAFLFPNYVCHRTDRPTAGGRYSHPSPPSCSPPLSARYGSNPLEGHCCSSHIGRQTCENPCGLPVIFPPIDRSGSDRLFRRGIAGPDGRQPERQTRGLEIAADHETVETPT